MIQEATIKGTQPARLVIFDLDDTLIISDAKIKVLDPKTQKIIAELTPAEFNFFKPSKKAVLSFEDFESADVLRKSEFIQHVYEKLKNYYKSGVHVSIVTARSSSSLIRNFFLENGIDIHPDLVIAVNDSKFGYSGNIAQRKKQAIVSLIEQGYKDFIFFDDNEDNLKLAKETEKENGVKVETVKV